MIHSNFSLFLSTRSILHGYFNPLVSWYQWGYLLTSKKLVFRSWLARPLRQLGGAGHQLRLGGAGARFGGWL